MGDGRRRGSRVGQLCCWIPKDWQTLWHPNGHKQHELGMSVPLTHGISLSSAPIFIANMHRLLFLAQLYVKSIYTYCRINIWCSHIALVNDFCQIQTLFRPFLLMRTVQDFYFEKNNTWWDKSQVEEYHKNMTKVIWSSKSNINFEANGPCDNLPSRNQISVWI